VYPAHLFKNTKLAGFGKEDSVSIRGDVFAAPVQWKSGKWSDLQGKRIRLRFYLTQSTLHSFWTKPEETILGVQDVPESDGR
jgi:hypothetical protein